LIDASSVSLVGLRHHDDFLVTATCRRPSTWVRRTITLWPRSTTVDLTWRPEIGISVLKSPEMSMQSVDGGLLDDGARRAEQRLVRAYTLLEA
jgi:hypothetical protein